MPRNLPEPLYTTPTPIPLRDLEHRLERLGYTLKRRIVDSLGRTWRYQTVPRGAGPVNYFDTVDEIAGYARQVESMEAVWTEAAEKSPPCCMCGAVPTLQTSVGAVCSGACMDRAVKHFKEVLAG